MSCCGVLEALEEALLIMSADISEYKLVDGDEQNECNWMRVGIMYVASHLGQLSLLPSVGW